MEVVSNVTAPAQKHATDGAVYTALLNVSWKLRYQILVKEKLEIDQILEKKML